MRQGLLILITIISVQSFGQDTIWSKHAIGLEPMAYEKDFQSYNRRYFPKAKYLFSYEYKFSPLWTFRAVLGGATNIINDNSKRTDRYVNGTMRQNEIQVGAGLKFLVSGRHSYPLQLHLAADLYYNTNIYYGWFTSVQESGTKEAPFEERFHIAGIMPNVVLTYYLMDQFSLDLTYGAGLEFGWGQTDIQWPGIVTIQLYDNFGFYPLNSSLALRLKYHFK